MAESRFSVLLIEDNSDHAALIRRQVAGVKDRLLTIEWVDRFALGLKRLEEGGIDAVLLDLNLPDSPSAQTLSRLVASYPQLPVVVLTAQDDLELGAAAVQQGAQDYLVKSQLTGDLIVRSVRYSIERKWAEMRLKALNETLEQRVVQRTAEAERRMAQLRWLAAELTLAEERERRRLSAVLHDHLQQLLVAAKMTLDHSRKQIEPADASEQLQRVQDLIGEAIQASRSLSVELSPPVLYDQGLAAALEWLGQQCQQKYGLRVDVEADPAAEPESEEARVLLFQAARELLFNVVKYAKVDSGRVTLKRLDDYRTELAVEDEGSGFDPERTQVGSGSGGFGLFSIRERLQLLGGQVELHSRPGQGTQVSLSVPRSGRRADGSELFEVPADQPLFTIRTEPSRKIRVVLAEDRAVLRRSLRRMLEQQADIEVVGEAADGAEVIEVGLATRPDVILMDVSMPNVDGIEATRRLCREWPGVKIIGLSMYENDAMAAQLCKAGALTYLAKDTPVEKIVAAIRGTAAPV